MSDCNECKTPATLVLLHTDKNGIPFEEKWEYDSYPYVSGRKHIP
jgi:hypothetical protein